MFEGASTTASNIITNIVHNIQDMPVLLAPQCKSSNVSIIQLEIKGVQVAQVKQKIGRWIKWEAASNCQLTLNTKH